jgi:hypothetical protein
VTSRRDELAVVKTVALIAFQESPF